MTTDKEHLQWMLNRLAEVHGENRNVDYMTRMQKIIDNTKTELNLHLVSGCFPTDKEIELLSNEHSDDMDLRPNTYHSYKDGMEECIDIIKKNINNR